jgi:myo-inositol-1(or 4)-monophosphatase
MTANPELLDELATLASAFAREAGALLADRQPRVRGMVATKSTPTDMVTEVDGETEALLVARIGAARPNDAILGEEGANRPGTSGVRWVIDPLDGTTNYLYGFPSYSVSMGVEVDGEAAVAAVFDASRGELYAATAGRGATLDSRLLHVTAQDQLPLALVGTGFGYDVERRRKQAAVAAYLVPRVRDIRRAGSAALDLCAVAAGRLDAYAEFGLNEWDRCAGLLIVNEAGGRAEVLPGAFDLELNLASAPAIFEPLHRLVAEALHSEGLS